MCISASNDRPATAALFANTRHRIGAVFRCPSGIPPDATSAWSTERSRHRRIGDQHRVEGPQPRCPRFFIEFLTEPEDVLLDIFSGSNTTG